MERNLVVCCDGTSNDVTGDITNVVRMYRALEQSDRQVIFYDPGVGTMSDPTKKTTWGKKISRYLDLGIGLSVRDNVCDAYRFLVNHYRSGDKIYLFGFSRGAYTVRALAGMLHMVGLLRPELTGTERHAWSVYADEEGTLAGDKRFMGADAFKQTFSVQPGPGVELIGVWDTVAAYGWFWDLRSAPYTAYNPSVRHVRHAVAIDERRALFRPNRFHPPENHTHTSIEEVWFTGTHGDVGGGWPEDRSGLAKIALGWMFEEVAPLGLHFKEGGREQQLQPPTTPTPGIDYNAVNNSMVWKWKPLELLPRRQWNQKKGRKAWLLPHLGRRRPLPADAVIHPSATTAKR
ncbi:MAG: DUF2235 domain-containing protein [Planctomycetota bacterium]